MLCFCVIPATAKEPLRGMGRLEKFRVFKIEEGEGEGEGKEKEKEKAIDDRRSIHTPPQLKTQNSKPNTISAHTSPSSCPVPAMCYEAALRLLIYSVRLFQGLSG